MQVDKVRIALVHNPGVVLGVALVETAMWAHHCAPVAAVEPFVVGHLHFKFNVVANVAVLPHEELDSKGELPTE